MLPTPSTAHINANHIYSPAEDSFLLLDTLSQPSETQFLAQRFVAVDGTVSPPPLVLEVGTGSGVVLAFIAANSAVILGRKDVLALGVDVNGFACQAARETVRGACMGEEDKGEGVVKRRRWAEGLVADVLLGDLATAIRSGSVDLLIFNPPYVPTAELPLPMAVAAAEEKWETMTRDRLFEEESRLLELAYAGGKDGMEITDRLLEQLPDVLSARGVAYIVLCSQNKPAEVVQLQRDLGFEVESVAASGKAAGWEKLQIVRIARPL